MPASDIIYTTTIIPSGEHLRNMYNRTDGLGGRTATKYHENEIIKVMR